MAIFESMGRTFFYRNHPRVLFCFLLLPLIAVSLLLAPRFLRLRTIEQEFDSAALGGRSALAKREKKESFLKGYSNFEPYFINQSLEALPFLQDELEKLHQLKDHPASTGKEEILRRITFLEGTENRLAFAEENILTSSHLKESEERLLHSIEIDENDLNRLLCLIEGVSIDHFSPQSRSPQLLIQDFSLSKKEGRDTYELNLALIKREFSYETKD